MSIALCEKNPHLEATVFDLPENIEKAREFVSKSGLENRIKCVSGDLTKDELPENFDVALLANLLAAFDAETNKKLFKRIYDKLPDGGACLDQRLDFGRRQTRAGNFRLVLSRRHLLERARCRTQFFGL